VKVIRNGESGRRGAIWHKVTFTLDFLALKGLIEYLTCVYGLGERGAFKI